MDGLTAVPGFTPEQSVALRTVARQTAEETVFRMKNEPCAGECPRVETLSDTVFGNGTPGLKTDVTELKKDVESLVWWYRILVAGVVSSWVAILVSYLQR